MDKAPRYHEFVYTDPFLTSAKGVLAESDFRELELQLLERPTRGAVIKGTDGLRKMRFALPGRGKSAGARVVYLVVEVHDKIYLINVFAKNVKATLTNADKKDFRAMVRMLKGE